MEKQSKINEFKNTFNKSNFTNVQKPLRGIKSDYSASLNSPIKELLDDLKKSVKSLDEEFDKSFKYDSEDILDFKSQLMIDIITITEAMGRTYLSAPKYPKSLLAFFNSYKSRDLTSNNKNERQTKLMNFDKGDGSNLPTERDCITATKYLQYIEGCMDFPFDWLDWRDEFDKILKHYEITNINDKVRKLIKDGLQEKAEKYQTAEMVRQVEEETYGDYCLPNFDEEEDEGS